MRTGTSPVRGVLDVAVVRRERNGAIGRETRVARASLRTASKATRKAVAVAHLGGGEGRTGEDKSGKGELHCDWVVRRTGKLQDSRRTVG